MNLFDCFEAVKFPQENLIFITNFDYLYYICDLKNKSWSKYHKAGNKTITIENYQDVSREEIENAMNGKFPEKETDFMRLCNPSELCISDMFDILEEDYENYMADGSVRQTIHKFFLKSNVLHKSFTELKKLLDKAVADKKDNLKVVDEIKELCFNIIGKDIFRKEIGIVDGHDASSYFWIMPARVIDYSDTYNEENVAEMRSAEISIEEDDFSEYLAPFLLKYYDYDLEANKNRVSGLWMDHNGNEIKTYLREFEWVLTPNFFTFESVEKVVKDIRETIDALSSGKENEFITKLKSGRSELIPSEEQSEEDRIRMIIDFYNRFIYRMEYMLTVGKENGYNLISFMGP